MNEEKKIPEEQLPEGMPMPAEPPVLEEETTPLWTEQETVEDLVEPAQAAVIKGNLAGAARTLSRMEGRTEMPPEPAEDTFQQESQAVESAVREAGEMAAALEAEQKAVEDAERLMPEEDEAATEQSDGSEDAAEGGEESAADAEQGGALVPEEDEEDSDDGKKKRRGRYKYHLEPDEYMWLMMNVDDLNGNRKKTMRTVKILLALAMVPIIDFCLHPGYWLAMIAGVVLMMAALHMKNVTKRNAKRAVRAEPGGPTVLIQAGEKGLLIQEPGRPQVVLPYDHMRKVFLHGGYDKKEYLTIITGPKTSAFIPRDLEHRGYKAIERRLRQKCSGRFVVQEEKEASKNKG